MLKMFRRQDRSHANFWLGRPPGQVRLWAEMSEKARQREGIPDK